MASQQGVCLVFVCWGGQMQGSEPWVLVPLREQGFASYWMEGSGVGLRHPLTLARATGTLGVSITVAASRPRPGEKPQKLPGEGKKLVKI